MYLSRSGKVFDSSSLEHSVHLSKGRYLFKKLVGIIEKAWASGRDLDHSENKRLVLVSSGGHNKTPEAGVLKHQTFTSHSSGGWKSKVKMLADSVPGENFPPGLQMVPRERTLI